MKSPFRKGEIRTKIFTLEAIEKISQTQEEKQSQKQLNQRNNKITEKCTKWKNCNQATKIIKIRAKPFIYFSRRRRWHWRWRWRWRRWGADAKSDFFHSEIPEMSIRRISEMQIEKDYADRYYGIYQIGMNQRNKWIKIQ